MTTVTLTNKINYKKKTASQAMRIAVLERQMAELRSVVSRVVSKEDRDPEGEYRPEFVREILKAAKEKPTRTFKDPESFLASLRSA